MICKSRSKNKILVSGRWFTIHKEGEMKDKGLLKDLDKGPLDNSEKEMRVKLKKGMVLLQYTDPNTRTFVLVSGT